MLKFMDVYSLLYNIIIVDLINKFGVFNYIIAFIVTLRLIKQDQRHFGCGMSSQARFYP